MLRVIDSVKSFDLSLNEIVVDLLFGFGDLLDGSLDQIVNLDVSGLDCLALVSASLVELLKLASLGHVSDSFASVEKFAGLTNSKVKVDVAVALEVIMLDSAAEELKNLVLDLVIVHEGFFAHGELCWHPDLPLDLVYESQSIQLGLSLFMTMNLPGR